MIANIITGASILVALTLFTAYFTGKNKPSKERSVLQKIACAIGTIFKGHLKESADALYSMKVLKEEAMQEVDNAIRNLRTSYKDGQVDMKVTLKKLNEVIYPNLKDMPGKLEAKARQAKATFESSVEQGSPIEAYKKNALKYLQLKVRAESNIEKVENNISKLQVAIETSKAQYDCNLVDLEMIKSELECMVEIPQFELNQSLERIKSLQEELSEKMNIEQIKAEVSEDMKEDLQSTVPVDLESMYNKL